MTERQIIKYCHFYRGETLPPLEYDNTNAGKLWAAEKFVCEQMNNLVDDDNPALSIAEIISSYIGKWAPFQYDDIMTTYLERCPDQIKSKFHQP